MPYSKVDGRYRRSRWVSSTPFIPVERTLQDALFDADTAIHAQRVKDADGVREATNRMLGEREPYEPFKPTKTQPDLFESD